MDGRAVAVGGIGALLTIAAHTVATMTPPVAQTSLTGRMSTSASLRPDGPPAGSAIVCIALGHGVDRLCARTDRRVGPPHNPLRTDHAGLDLRRHDTRTGTAGISGRYRERPPGQPPLAVHRDPLAGSDHAGRQRDGGAAGARGPPTALPSCSTIPGLPVPVPPPRQRCGAGRRGRLRWAHDPATSAGRAEIDRALVLNDGSRAEKNTVMGDMPDEIIPPSRLMSSKGATFAPSIVATSHDKGATWSVAMCRH